MACIFFALFQPLRSLVLVLHRNDLVQAHSQTNRKRNAKTQHSFA